MDIFRFINSKDIRYYLKDKNYVFNALEASWLVYQCRDASLDEKHEAWKEISLTTPDCPIEERFNCSFYPSLHEFLNDYMDLQNRMTELVKADEDKTFFKLSFYESRTGWYEDYGTKASYKDAYEEAMEELKDLDITSVRISKAWIGTDKEYYIEIGRGDVVYNVSGNVFDNTKDENLFFQSFDGLWFDIPVPFKTGDIIWNPNKIAGFCAGPMVYMSNREPVIYSEYAEEKKLWHKEGMNNNSFIKDSSDMVVEGYFQNDDGQLYREVESNLMDYEYYTGNLEGKKALLKALSNCLNKKIDEVAFANAYHSILEKEEAERSIPDDYSDKEMFMMGLSDAKKDCSKDRECNAIRWDTAKNKRVELSCFTNMSPKAGIATAEEYIKKACDWGMDAIAITDMANVQAFPDALKAVKKLNNPPKVIYGIHAAFNNSCRDHGIDNCKAFSQQDAGPNILVKNKTGLKNLYKLLTDEYCNHIDFLQKISDSNDAACREGLLIGSGGWDLEVQEEIENRNRKIEDFIGKAAEFDYLEVHPCHSRITEAEFENRINYMIKLGELTDKIVVATGNAGYIEPEDKICLDIFCNSYKSYDSASNEKRYLMTTNEMLREFAFLGNEKAEEIVIKNTRKIADMIEAIEPIPGTPCSLVIDNADEILKNECEVKHNSIYPAGVPDEALERLKKELEGIGRNGYASDYVIGMRLVRKSNADGFPVVLRGCGAGSFVAFLSGITDINPLPAHYYCPKCGHYEFVKGLHIVEDDLEEKSCDTCGCRMQRHGYNLPAEPFTGLEGDKDPDFDFNFSGEYQQKIIEYLKELFGQDRIIRPGTIGTGYALARSAVDHYDGHLTLDEKERITVKLSAVKRTNGIHPGGVLIIPENVDISDYTPLQRIDHVKEKTTHFEYHALEKNFKRLDCLGHRGPTMLFLLKELTGKELEIDEKNRGILLKLFKNIYSPSDNSDEINYGTSGLPEFDNRYTTDRDINELIKVIKPESINDLIRLVTLFHGTGTWEGNAREYLKSLTATFNEIICSRDDIYLYLLSRGIKKDTAYEIMENVRKGKAGTGRFKEWNVCKAIMREHDVPQWYIDSCEKIRYLFPKAHGTGYTLMSLKIALYKIFCPEEFYAVYAAVDSEKLRDYIGLPNKQIDNIIRNKPEMEGVDILKEMKCRNINYEKVRSTIDVLDRGI